MRSSNRNRPRCRLDGSAGYRQTSPAHTSDAAPAPAAPAASHNGNGFERKLGVLETDIKDLKQMMIGQLQEMENKSQKFREDQFRQLVTLLKQERQQKEELLRQVTRLEMDNKTLKRVGRMLKEKLLGISASPPRK